MGKIADAYVEIGGDDAKFKVALNNLSSQVADASKKTTAVSTNFAQGVLQASRGIQDFAAAGLNGIINNVEGIAAGFGLGSGVAGAATLAAVAIQQLGPKIYELFAAVSPLGTLSKDLKEIANSGLDNTFMGMAANAKAMTVALEASVEQLQKMEKQTERVVFAAAGPGMGAAPIMQNVGASIQDIMNKQHEVNNLARDAAAAAFEAQRGKQDFTEGGLGKFHLTTQQLADQEINKKLFQSAVDKFGGGEALFKRMDFMTGGENSALYGKFKRGDAGASMEAVQLLGLQEEKARLLAEDFDKATGAAAELSAIEKEMAKARADKALEQQRFDDAIRNRMNRETERAAQLKASLENQKGAIEERMSGFQASRQERLFNAFNFASLGEARDRMFMAGREDKQDQLTASKMAAEIDKVVAALDKLKVKWNMVD